MFLDMLPNGLFHDLLSVWHIVLESFSSVLSTLGSLTFTLGTLNVNVISVLLGPALSIYFGVVLTRWVKQTFFT